MVQYLKEKCNPEPILEDLGCLLHADDTLILSTNRNQFITKCNHMIDYFDENQLSLNFKKSAFLVINGKEEEKSDLNLKNGILEYKSTVTYLGAIISDTGNLKHDVDLYLEEKRSNVTIKYGNFCRKNFLAPLDIKLRILNTCISASITYGCETWGCSNFNKIETLYRLGLKTALSIRHNINNEIVYLESGELPLDIRIVKQQINFWQSLQSMISNNPDHFLSRLVHTARDYPFVKYYVDLLTKYQNEYRSKYEEKIRNDAANDLDSRLGTYLLINPTLEKPCLKDKIEFQRVCITRYRTGSHNLLIEKGRRSPQIPRDERICKCNNDIQTIKHVITDCHLLQDLRLKYGVTDFFSGLLNEDFLTEMESLLEIKS